MTFVEALGGQNGETIIEALGGTPGNRLEEVMAVKEIEISDNPLAALAMDFDISDSIDLLGKKASDLQEEMAVDAYGKVTGISKYVTGYTGFSGDPAEQKGNYVALHISVGELVIGTNVAVKINGVTLDPDGLFVMIIKEGTKNPKAVVTASAEGHNAFTRFFDFSKVVRMPAENEEEEVVKYTVSYNANGGTGSIDPVEVTAGESITVSDGTGLTAPEGKEFTGWAKTDSAQSATVVSPFTPDKDTILYAVWTDAAPVEEPGE